MVKKKTTKKVKRISKKVTSKTAGASKKKSPKLTKNEIKKFPTLNLKSEQEIALDFGTKVYEKFSKLIKSIVLFGSVSKQNVKSGSDIDIIIILDDVSVQWDSEMIVWYRDELDKIAKNNPYPVELHINTIKLSTWWEDLMKGDPVVLNILRDGHAVIDYGGFFEPLQYLLVQGKIKSSPESIYSLLQRAPTHITRSRISELNSIEGLYWSMVDSSQAALIAAGLSPASPEHIPMDLKTTFVDNGKLKMKYIEWYRDLLILHKKIAHGDINNLKGAEIDVWQEKAEDFLRTMVKLIDDIVS